MAWSTVYSPAKINLFLELAGRQDDGFHLLDTVMVKVSLCDTLSFRPRPDDRICLQQLPGRTPVTERLRIPLDQGNLVWQAIQALRQASGRSFGVDVIIRKNIPVAAGLGGGSGNAVVSLVTLNRLLNLGLPPTQLVEIANRLGSDLAFFFAPAAARCTGRGQQVSPLPGFRRLWLVIGSPPQGLSTARVFGQAELPGRPESAGEFIGRWNRGMPLPPLHNRLQPAAGLLSPWIGRLRSEFDRVGCRAHQMSGSGSAWFGLFPGRRQAVRSARCLQARMPDSRFFPVRTIGNEGHPTGLEP